MIRLAVVGSPISHSRSPVIHAAALGDLGIEGTYQAIEMTIADIGRLEGELRSGRLDGANVTMPLKEAAASMVDDLDRDAADAGSVNTVTVASGKLVGHSTDVSALRRLWPLADRPTLVLGSGGAARASLVAAPSTSTYVSARDPNKAAALAGELKKPAQVVCWGTAVVDAVVVNATPLGMDGESLPGGVIELSGALVDLPYAAQETPSCRIARNLGLPTIDGLEVLVAQASDSFRLWTGREAPENVMTNAVRKSLKQVNRITD